MKRKLFTRLFWIDTFERAVWTGVESFVGVASFEAVINGGFTDNLWLWAGSAGFGAGIAVLKAIGAAAKNDTDSASTSNTIASRS